MTKLDELKKRLRRGQVYRREGLAKWSSAVDRHLRQLVDDGTLTKLAGGLYAYPKQTAFGEAPAADGTLVETFLKDDRFLLASPNAYNGLGVGTTQLYDKTVVYNHKRHGSFSLGGRMFDFRVKPSFPKRLSEEFLLVDLVNNLDRLAESKEEVLARVRERVAACDAPRLQRAVRDYGNVRTKKFFAHVTTPIMEPRERRHDFFDRTRSRMIARDTAEPVAQRKPDAETKRAADAFLRRLTGRYVPVEALLYGSRARGDHAPDSDADIAVILKGRRGNRYEAVRDLSDAAHDAMLETGIYIQPLPVWRVELERPELFSNPALLENIKRDGLRL